MILNVRLSVLHLLRCESVSAAVCVCVVCLCVNDLICLFGGVGVVLCID